MAITYLDYVPVLKWRQGEYQALMRLRSDQKTAIVPLLEITPPDFDFELNEPRHTIDTHLAEFAKRLQAKWESRLALLDTGLLDPGERMASGTHPLLWLLDAVRAQGGNLVPVTAVERDAGYQDAVRIANQVDGRGAALRCSLEDASDPEFEDNVEALLERIDVEIDRLDILIDLRSPNFEPIDGLAQLIVAVLTSSDVFLAARSLTILASAFPASMAEVTPPMMFVRRREWELYKRVIALLPQASDGQLLVTMRSPHRIFSKATCG